jgi:hypothetical protein
MLNPLSDSTFITGNFFMLQGILSCTFAHCVVNPRTRPLTHSCHPKFTTVLLCAQFRVKKGVLAQFFPWSPLFAVLNLIQEIIF